jgi:putative inorganic carbon (HCO3(-)) transporter
MTRPVVQGMDPQVAEKKTRYLYWWLLVSLFLEYARPASYLRALGILPLNSVVPLTLFVACLFAKGLRPTSAIFSDRFSRYLMWFVGMISVSVLHAAVTHTAYEVWVMILGYAFLFFVIAKIATDATRIRGVFMVLIVAHLFLLVMNPEVVTDPSSRHYVLGATFLGDGNDFSLSICILLPFAIELAASAKSRLLKVFWVAVLLLLVLALIGTQSRGAALGMGGLVIYFWMASRRKMLGLLIVMLLGAVVVAYAPDVFFERMGTIANYQTEGSAMGRIEAWKAGLRMVADNPVLGVGAGHYPIAFGTTYRPPGLVGTPWLTAHSMYFLVLGELGLPGIFLVLGLVLGNIRANGRIRRLLQSRASLESIAGAEDTVRLLRLLTGSTIGFGVAAAFLSVAYYPHLFVLTALQVAARSVALSKMGMAREPGAAVGCGRRLMKPLLGRQGANPQDLNGQPQAGLSGGSATGVRRA